MFDVMFTTIFETGQVYIFYQILMLRLMIDFYTSNMQFWQLKAGFNFLRFFHCYMYVVLLILFIVCFNIGISV